MREHQAKAILLALSVLILLSCTGGRAEADTDIGTETAEKTATDTHVVSDTGMESVSDAMTAKDMLLTGYWVCEEMSGQTADELLEEYNMPPDSICTMQFLEDGEIHLIMYGHGLTAEYSMDGMGIKS